jgi:hypothetical protein
MKTHNLRTRLLCLGAALLLSACATTIKQSQPVDSAAQATALVQTATAQVASGVVVPPGTAQKLEQAVLKEAGARAAGTTPVKLKMTITRWDVTDAGTRFLIGAMRGSNKLDVAVDVVDLKSGQTIGHYDVQRRANPGGYGTFYDQAEATIDQGAKGVIEGLYGAGK